MGIFTVDYERELGFVHGLEPRVELPQNRWFGMVESLVRDRVYPRLYIFDKDYNLTGFSTLDNVTNIGTTENIFFYSAGPLSKLPETHDFSMGYKIYENYPQPGLFCPSIVGAYAVPKGTEFNHKKMLKVMDEYESQHSSFGWVYKIKKQKEDKNEQ